MEKISRFLDESLKKAGLGGRIKESKVFQYWPGIVGPSVAAKAKPRAIRQGVLLVETTSAAWSNQLTLLKPQLLEAIRQAVGPGIVKEIKFQITAWKEDRSAPREEKKFSSLGGLPELGAGEKKIIGREIAALIGDPELADTVSRFMEILKRRKDAQLASGFRECSCGSLYQGAEQRCPICRIQKK
ncbi:MAG TPA: hypothetical protein DD435_16345 [Cyanobacteria bacterium UBA8530]|nr:hypothetical protein [Cyanobacteria bacterium UBA8530]